MTKTVDEGATDKRRFPRVEVLYLASYVSKEEGVQQTPVSMGRILDVSQAGMRVEVCEPVSVGADMELEIAIDEKGISVRGRVIHAQPGDNDRTELGIAFTRPVPELEQ